MSTSVVRLRRFFSSAVCPSRLRSASSDAVVLPLDRQRMSTASRWCRRHCAAQDAREEEKVEGEFPFLFPPVVCLFISPIYMSI